MHESSDQSERRISLAAYFHNIDESEARQQDNSLSFIRTKIKRNLPKSYPELKLF